MGMGAEDDVVCDGWACGWAARGSHVDKGGCEITRRCAFYLRGYVSQVAKHHLNDCLSLKKTF